jgi:hypothetical protein
MQRFHTEVDARNIQHSSRTGSEREDGQLPSI